MAAARARRLVADVLAWAEAMLAADRLTRDIGGAGARISDLVGAGEAVLAHGSGPGQAAGGPAQSASTRRSSCSATRSSASMTIERAYADDLPPVGVYPGEINQVWTNLLDNAIDAVPEGG